jgi:hypothetical protein
MPKLLLCGLAAACLYAQTSDSSTLVVRSNDQRFNKYQFTCSGTASASAPNCIVQLPSTVTTLKVVWDTVAVRSAEVTTVTFGWGGTTPSGGTAKTPRARNTTTASSVTVKQEATPAGSPTNTSFAIPTANIDFPFSLYGEVWPIGNSTTRTLNISLGTITGAWQITGTFGETN